MTARTSGPAVVALADGAAHYAHLRQLARQNGLFDRQPRYYAYKISFNLSLLTLSILFLVLVDSFLLQLLNALILAFVLVQISFIGHDVGHQQVFGSARKNAVLQLVVSLIFGSSRTWWVEKHNQHHSNPNDLDLDPDTDIPLWAFSESQALSKRGLYKLLSRYQAFLFYVILSLEGFGLRLASVLYMLRHDIKYPRLEPLILIAHITIYAGSIFYFLGGWDAALFIVINQLAIGLYAGSVFAPNHKGMPLLGRDAHLDFLTRQVVTARNIKSGFLNDFLFGGLNYQIEHHLFPTMSRNRLKEAKKLIEPFCLSHSIPYREESVFESQKTILRYLHAVSAPLRVKAAASTP
jgi:fatty acid desaturase